MENKKISELIDCVYNNFDELLLKNSGSIFYSPINTFDKGDYYFLGINPGGSPDEHPLKDELLKINECNECAYISQNWSSGKKHYDKGYHPFQLGYKEIMKILNILPEKVCSSNLVFLRSKNLNTLKNFYDLAEKCWKVHKFILEIVQPKIIITTGISKKSPFSFIYNNYYKNKLIINDINKEPIKSGYGNWKCYNFEINLNGRNTLVISIPHLSYYRIGKYENILSWIKNLVDNKLQYESTDLTLHIS